MLQLHRMGSSTLRLATNTTGKRLLLSRGLGEAASKQSSPPHQSDADPFLSPVQPSHQQSPPPMMRSVVDDELAREQAELVEATIALRRKIVEADKCFRLHVPNFMTPDFRIIVHTLLTPDVQYDDLVRGYKTRFDCAVWLTILSFGHPLETTSGFRGVSDLIWLTAKTRFYLYFKSPMNRFEWIGSAIHPETDSMTVLWRLSTLASMGFFYKYGPLKLFSPKNYPPRIIEGAVDCYFTPTGLIHQMVNRELNAKDRENAQLTAQTKQEVAEKMQEEKRKSESKYAKYL